MMMCGARCADGQRLCRVVPMKFLFQEYPAKPVVERPVDHASNEDILLSEQVVESFSCCNT